MIELTKDYIDNLKDIITEKDDAKIKEILDELYPADIAELYQELNLQEAIYLYLLMDGEKAADVLMELDEVVIFSVCLQFFLRHLGVGGGGWMNHQGLDVGHVREQGK